MADTSVLIGYYGDRDHWEPLVERAVRSAENQTIKVRIVTQYADSLHEARNTAASKVSSEYLVWLDADDALSPNYCEAMLNGTADLRQPATLGVYADGSEDPFPVNIPPKPSIRDGNWFVIGTMMPRELFLQAGGFWDEPAWEDYSLMLRCFALGATWEPIPEAVYRVHVNPRGRNEAVAGDLRLLQRIIRANDEWAFERGLVIS